MTIRILFVFIIAFLVTIDVKISAEKLPDDIVRVKNIRGRTNKQARGSKKKKTTVNSLTVGTLSFTGCLSDTGCYDTKENGSWGYCGPQQCQENYITCEDLSGACGSTGSLQADEDTCKEFMPRTDEEDLTDDDWGLKGACDDSCTQETDGVCSGEFLAQVLTGDGVKYAYCNDKWLVIGASGEASIFTPNLDDIPNPPKTSDGTQVTGMESLSTHKPGELFYPLDVSLHPTAAKANNLDLFPSNWLVVDGESVGIPDDGDIGMAVNGQSIFPIYNNQGVYTPEKCETDSCSEHVGQGGGQPHFHGDPFGNEDSDLEGATYCLYGPSSYLDGTSGHPPIIGFSYDGILIYGRYLNENAPGFQAPLLDECGGHVHDGDEDIDPYGIDLASTYHYHTQVFDAVCGDNYGLCDEGTAYTATTTGPLNCWRGDLSANEGSSALFLIDEDTYLGKQDMEYHCCGMTDYYLKSGIPDPHTDDVDSSSSCTSPSSPPDNGSWESGSLCETVGSTMYSGNRCYVECDDGYIVSGKTQCIKGTLYEATCELDTGTESANDSSLSCQVNKCEEQATDDTSSTNTLMDDNIDDSMSNSTDDTSSTTCCDNSKSVLDFFTSMKDGFRSRGLE